MAEKKANRQSEMAVSKSNEIKDFKKIVGALGISTRGRIFQGKVIRKFPKRVTIEFERTVRVHKYERFMKKNTRLHARLPEEFADQIHIGDLIRVQECRPLSKTIHSVVIEKIRNVNSDKGVL